MQENSTSAVQHTILWLVYGIWHYRKSWSEQQQQRRRQQSQTQDTDLLSGVSGYLKIQADSR